ncbi:hydrogenase maturation protease [Synechococcus sp. RSCCF101]|uniref:hydrogenase maturation protease n=1 Tax=Synechococcus sp. RSCCF101 TaxID=2511069 RepID=UPI001245063D|nr:hydrogenase maturation protease [Synechococcus sp. RSCCF101]QEY33057.1 hydrogenase maturation protease [Synechococcus sp. RSCCF101]
MATPQRSGPAALVIGIGNPLRGDDGVGALLAEEAGGRSVHQLTPELAAELAPLQRVLFIDAWLAPPDPSDAHAHVEAPVPEPRLDPLPAGACGGVDGVSHRLEPPQLLAISAALYGRAPAAAWLRVPGHAFAHGTEFSARLEYSLPVARDLLQRWLQEGCVVAGNARGGHA